MHKNGTFVRSVEMKIQESLKIILKQFVGALTLRNFHSHRMHTCRMLRKTK